MDSKSCSSPLGGEQAVKNPNDRGKLERAVETYELTCCFGAVANSRWFEDVAGKQIAAAPATLPPRAVVAAQERGRSQNPWAAAEELLAELSE